MSAVPKDGPLRPSLFRLHASRLRRYLASPSRRPTPPGRVFHAQARRFTVAQILTRAFYAFLLYLAISQLDGNLPPLLEHAPASPLWPIAWLRWTPPAAAAPRVLMAFYLATNVLGAFTVSWRASRVLTFLGLLEFVAYKNSFGKIGHSLHLPLLVAGAFALLPDGWDRPAPQVGRRTRQETLLVFWLAQAGVLMSYTMSGVAKLSAGLYQLFAGQPNAFSPGGLSAIIAQRLLQTHSSTLLGTWIVHHPYLTWPALPAAIYLELFAFLVAFRPSLGRPWAALLVLFHVGTYLTMTISFPQSCFLLVIFFFPSPFESDRTRSWQQRLLDIPVISGLYRFLQTTRRLGGVYTR